MRVAILADIHGNLPACEAVVADIKREKPDLVIAAGDLALRGPYPRETIDLLYDSCDALLMGNTDAYLADTYLGGAYRDPGHWKSELLSWTRNELGPARLEKLKALPFSLRYSPKRGQDLYICHANPRNLEESLEPTLDEAVLKRYLAHVDATAVAFGHLHFPYRRKVGRQLIADVASAGIPRDGDLRPAYGIFTYSPKGWRVQLRRVRYAVRQTTAAINDRKMPGASVLIHKMLECRYRNHKDMALAARRHAGLPPDAPKTLPMPEGAPTLKMPPLSRTEPPTVQLRGDAPATVTEPPEASPSERALKTEEGD